MRRLRRRGFLSLETACTHETAYRAVKSYQATTVLPVHPYYYYYYLATELPFSFFLWTRCFFITVNYVLVISSVPVIRWTGPSVLCSSFVRTCLFVYPPAVKRLRLRAKRLFFLLRPPPPPPASASLALRSFSSFSRLL
jgi:hypothetical protein